MTDIASLFQTEPPYSQEDRTQIIAELRKKRAQFNVQSELKTTPKTKAGVPQVDASLQLNIEL